MNGTRTPAPTTAGALRDRGWSLWALITLQLLFAACATSVLIYRAADWAPEIIHFGWLSFRAWNIYLSLVMVFFLVWALWRTKPWSVPLLAAFSLFHLVDGLLIGFWTKSLLHALTLFILAWAIYSCRVNVPRARTAKEPNP